MLLPTTGRMKVVCELQVLVPDGAKLFHDDHGPAIELAVAETRAFKSRLASAPETKTAA